MRVLSYQDFNKLEMLDDNDRVRLYDGSVIKLCCLQYDFLNSLKSFKLQHFSTPFEILEEKSDKYLIAYLTLSKFLNNYIHLEDLNINDYSTKEVLTLYKNIFSSLKIAHDNGLYINDIHGCNILVNPSNLDYQFFDFDYSYILKDKVLCEREELLSDLSDGYIRKRYFKNCPDNGITSTLKLEDKHYMLETFVEYLCKSGIIKYRDLLLMPHIADQLCLPDNVKKILNSAYYDHFGFEEDDYLNDVFDTLIKYNYTFTR